MFQPQIEGKGVHQNARVVYAETPDGKSLVDYGYAPRSTGEAITILKQDFSVPHQDAVESVNEMSAVEAQARGLLKQVTVVNLES